MIVILTRCDNDSDSDSEDIRSMHCCGDTYRFVIITTNDSRGKIVKNLNYAIC